jgi:isochorismate pyruvate lyase
MRAHYVHAAARFKSSEAAVAAPERLEAMLKTRRTWAARENLSPDFVEKLYREIVAWFIGRETEEWKNIGSSNPARTG